MFGARYSNIPVFTVQDGDDLHVFKFQHDAEEFIRVQAEEFKRKLNITTRNVIHSYTY